MRVTSHANLSHFVALLKSQHLTLKTCQKVNREAKKGSLKESPIW